MLGNDGDPWLRQPPDRLAKSSVLLFKMEGGLVPDIICRSSDCFVASQVICHTSA